MTFDEELLERGIYLKSNINYCKLKQCITYTGTDK